mmetsp:Transcript_6155/g.8866  ORF Transcript_6155/g.8866 Transcript_6155/m.8866 type:complete len:258 (+) Transcript_6155:2-775(+)
MNQKEEVTRRDLLSDAGTKRQAAVSVDDVPKHIAVIMDGNRRYGKAKYGSATKGHWDGSRTLVDFCKWCIAEHVQTLTVYAFSTENWSRPPDEVASLMAIFCKYCDELRIEAIQRNIRIHVLSTDTSQIPSPVKVAMRRMVEQTAHCNGFVLNICLSYGSRGEIVTACQNIACSVKDGTLEPAEISESVINGQLLTQSDPDVVIRTSGEYRISNFLLWQLAYAELFFIKKTWPEMRQTDLVDVIQTFARGRQRRFGK